ncbi:MAG: alpha/beta hydrolase [Proteobacteria bacterium]|nr:alpha/beta hydrolase [Pseudomonadota bacterium]
MTDIAISPHFITTPSGARLRTATFPAPAGVAARGVCVLLHGQTEFIGKYGEVIGELQARGFIVATFDWRGQGMSSRALPDSRKSHISDFREYDEDLATFMDEIVRPLGCPPPLALAHSMGGNILIRTLHDKPGAFKAAVLSAPMLAVSTRGYPRWFANGITALMNGAGRADGWVLGMEGRDPLNMKFEDNLVTSDRNRFARQQALIAKQPEIRLAGPTWGWLKAASASMATVMAPGYAEAIETPVLLCGAGKDRIVLTPPARDFTHRLPHGTYVEFEDSEHEILMENDSIRERFWKAFDDFVAAQGI